MLAKFATAKNREMLNPLKVSFNRCNCLKATLNMCKIGLQMFPQLGLQPQTFRFQVSFQVPRSTTELYRERTTPSRIYVPCKISSCRVTGTRMLVAYRCLVTVAVLISMVHVVYMRGNCN